MYCIIQDKASFGSLCSMCTGQCTDLMLRQCFWNWNAITDHVIVDTIIVMWTADFHSSSIQLSGFKLPIWRFNTCLLLIILPLDAVVVMPWTPVVPGDWQPFEWFQGETPEVAPPADTLSLSQPCRTPSTTASRNEHSRIEWHLREMSCRLDHRVPHLMICTLNIDDTHADEMYTYRYRSIMLK